MRSTFIKIALGAAFWSGLANAIAQPDADPAFNECAACHSTRAGENGVGPSLYGIVGAKAAAVEGFRFSGPMKRSGITWTATQLEKFVADPQAVVPGTRMPYQGMQDAKKRVALILYLGTLK